MPRSASPSLPRIRVLATGGAIPDAKVKGACSYKAAAFSVATLIAAVSAGDSRRPRIV